MNQEIFNKLKKEGLYLIVSLIALIIISKLMLQDDLITIAKVMFNLFWLFIIPGYLIMTYWVEKMNFFTRTILGISLSAAILGIGSYHLSIIGIHIKILSFVLPIVLIVIGLWIVYKKL